MTKKSLDEKYSYQIDEHNVVHLFRGEDDCQQHLTNPLLSAIFKIEELEAQIEQNKIDLAISEHDREHNDYELTEAYKKIEQLEKENVKLKCNCRTCVYMDSPCVPSDYSNKDGVCSHYKNVLDENTELRGLVNQYKASKCSSISLVNRNMIMFEQLTKAKEIIDDLVHLGEFNEHTDEEYVNYQVHEALKNAEQFLKEIE